MGVTMVRVLSVLPVKCVDPSPFLWKTWHILQRDMSPGWLNLSCSCRRTNTAWRVYCVLSQQWYNNMIYCKVFVHWGVCEIYFEINYWLNIHPVARTALNVKYTGSFEMWIYQGNALYGSVIYKEVMLYRDLSEKSRCIIGICQINRDAFYGCHIYRVTL